MPMIGSVQDPVTVEDLRWGGEDLLRVQDSSPAQWLVNCAAPLQANEFDAETSDGQPSAQQQAVPVATAGAATADDNTTASPLQWLQQQSLGVGATNARDDAAAPTCASAAQLICSICMFWLSTLVFQWLSAAHARQPINLPITVRVAR